MGSSTKFFPFCPGIPWKLKKGKYIIPELPVSCFFDAIKTRDVVVSAFGGLLESFYSLSILETINRTVPGTPLFWCGNKEFQYLVQVNGLAKICDNVNQYDLDRFPTPIFYDKNNTTYFNCLNNYLDVKTCSLDKGYHDKRPVIKQIVEKSTIPWTSRDLPVLRNINKPNDIDHYLKMHRLHINSPFVLMFPDNKYSNNECDCLSLDITQIRAIAAILQQRNISLVILSSNIHMYAYSQAKVLPLRLDFSFYLINKALAIMSRSVDFLMVAGVLSKSKLISVSHKYEFNLLKNMKFIDATNDIYLKETLQPIEVCDFIEKG